jgi:hypothetical protein
VAHHLGPLRDWMLENLALPHDLDTLARRAHMSRRTLTRRFSRGNRYEATMHFNGQSTVVLGGDRATGHTYCVAHHVYSQGGERKLMVAALRYRDVFVKQEGSWRFAERRLYLDCAETRELRS